ncbi:hypothetical protein PoB_003066400 [Plakobranchus ocellatus]|uniref:Salivary lipocalin n=1 Tax=Plakobranchus ocellatus TaxID=259542 RepID=A0AAV4A927_9GAST|nr:hypothetical protein PoB_003066400 [Plakobranchus ocellatus]
MKQEHSKHMVRSTASTALCCPCHICPAATMYLRTVLLLLCVLAISSVQGKRKPVVLKINKPLNKEKSTKPLSLDCSFKMSMTKMKTVKSLTILRSETGKEESYKPIATLTHKSKTSNLGDSELTIDGKIDEGGESTVLAQYAAPDSGYCFFYKCVVEGSDEKGDFRTYNRKRRDKCGKKKRNPSADADEQSKTGTKEIEKKVEPMPTSAKTPKVPPKPASKRPQPIPMPTRSRRPRVPPLSAS